VLTDLTAREIDDGLPTVRLGGMLPKIEGVGCRSRSKWNSVHITDGGFGRHAA
jgi:hypothetical protein